MSDFMKQMPELQIMLTLEPEELAGYLLVFFRSIPDKDQQRNLMRPDWLASSQPVKNYPLKDQESVSLALMEAWSWLVREGLVVPRGDGCYFLSRRSRTLIAPADVGELRTRSSLPKHILHPTIADKAWPAFLRGEYDTAVFQAFKEVEVAVRHAGRYGLTDLGTDLMRKAFHSATGPLTDTSEPSSERDALAHLFAGAIGRFKNPSSHRHVAITDPGETFEMLAFASHLLRIVDDRRKVVAPP